MRNLRKFILDMFRNKLPQEKYSKKLISPEEAYCKTCQKLSDYWNCKYVAHCLILASSPSFTECFLFTMNEQTCVFQLLYTTFKVQFFGGFVPLVLFVCVGFVYSAKHGPHVLVTFPACPVDDAYCTEGSDVDLEENSRQSESGICKSLAIPEH